MKRKVMPEALKGGTSIGVLVLMYTMYMARALDEDPYALNIAAANATRRMLRSWTPSK